jgi:hypothetical protein
MIWIEPPSHRDGLQSIFNGSLPADLPTLILFFQPAHKRLEVIHHCPGRDVLAGGLLQDFAPVFGSTFFKNVIQPGADLFVVGVVTLLWWLMENLACDVIV